MYGIKLSWGESYVGQTGCCINDRLREYADTVRTGTGSNLALHCAKYLCSPAFGSTVILTHYREQCTRENHETFMIHTMGEWCVSTPSLELFGGAELPGVVVGILHVALFHCHNQLFIIFFSFLLLVLVYIRCSSKSFVSLSVLFFLSR